MHHQHPIHPWCCHLQVYHVIHPIIAMETCLSVSMFCNSYGKTLLPKAIQFFQHVQITTLRIELFNSYDQSSFPMMLYSSTLVNGFQGSNAGRVYASFKCFSRIILINIMLRLICIAAKRSKKN